MYLKYLNNQEELANYVYRNSLGNWDQKSGDGSRFRWGGYIQLTGRENYSNFWKSIGKKTAEETVEYVRTPRGALESALWFWQKNDLNRYSSNVIMATKKINWGFNGLQDRRNLHKYFSKMLE